MSERQDGPTGAENGAAEHGTPASATGAAIETAVAENASKLPSRRTFVKIGVVAGRRSHIRRLLQSDHRTR